MWTFHRRSRAARPTGRFRRAVAATASHALAAVCVIAQLAPSSSFAAMAIRRSPRRARGSVDCTRSGKSAPTLYGWTLSRAPAWASSEVASLRPRGTRAAGPWGRPWPPPVCAPGGYSGQRRARVDPPRAAPRGSQSSTFPVRPHRAVNSSDRPDFRQSDGRPVSAPGARR